MKQLCKQCQAREANKGGFCSGICKQDFYKLQSSNVEFHAPIIRFNNTMSAKELELQQQFINSRGA